MKIETSKLMEDKKTIVNAIEVAADRIEKYRIKEKSHRKQKLAWRAEKKEISEKIESMTLNYDTVNNSLKDQLREKDAEVTKLLDQIEKVTNKLELVGNSEKKLQADIKKIQNTLALRGKSDVENAVTKDRLSREIEQLKLNLGSKNEKIASMKLEISEIKENLKKRDADYTALKQKNEIVLHDSKNIEIELVNTKNQLNNLTNELNSSRKTCDEFKVHLYAYQNQNTLLRNKLEKLIAFDHSSMYSISPSRGNLERKSP